MRFMLSRTLFCAVMMMNVVSVCAQPLSSADLNVGQQTVVSFASVHSAGDAANKASDWLKDAAERGLTAINVSSAFRYPHSEQGTLSGGLQGATEWDVYLLVICRPLIDTPTCSL